MFAFFRGAHGVLVPVFLSAFLFAGAAPPAARASYGAYDLQELPPGTRFLSRSHLLTALANSVPRVEHDVAVAYETGREPGFLVDILRTEIVAAAGPARRYVTESGAPITPDEAARRLLLSEGMSDAWAVVVDFALLNLTISGDGGWERTYAHALGRSYREADANPVPQHLRPAVREQLRRDHQVFRDQGGLRLRPFRSDRNPLEVGADLLEMQRRVRSRWRLVVEELLREANFVPADPS